MDSRIKIVLVVVVFVALGGVVWYWVGDSPELPPPPEADVETVAVVRDADIVEPLPREEAAPVEVAAPSVEKKKPKRAKKAETGEGVITVRVVDMEGREVSGAQIVLERLEWAANEEQGEDHVRYEGVSGADGTGVFRDLPDGSYAARAWTSTGGQSGTGRLREGQREEDILLELWDGAATGGMVTNAAGEGIANAIVHVYETDRFPGQILTTSRSSSARVYSDEDGHFEFPSLWIGKWRLYANADGYASVITDEIDGGDRDLHIVLGEGGSVSGMVIDERTSTGLPNIEVTLVTGFARDNFTARSDVDGSFTVDAVRAGDYELTVVDVDLVPIDDAPKITIADGVDASGYDLIVTPGAIITGRVYDLESGDGFAGAKVYVRGASGQRTSQPEILTLRDGSYEARGLAKGTYTVQLGEVPGLSSQRMSQNRKTVGVEPGEFLEEVDFGLERGLTIAGRVTDTDGQGVEEARVTGRTERGNTYSDTKTDRFGVFELTGFKPMQEIHVSASKSGLASRPLTPVAISDQNVTGLEIELVAEATIEGIIVDASGKPLSRAGIYARQEAPSIGSNSDESGVGGVFKLEGLSEGKYNLYAARDRNSGYTTGTPLEVVTVRAGEHATGIRLTLDIDSERDSLKIRGRVTNRHGEGIAGVNIYGWGGSGREQIQARTGSNGKYVARNVAEGSYNLQVQHPEYTSAQFNAAAGDKNADIELLGRGSIAGRVVHGQTGQPIERFEIVAYQGGAQVFRNNPNLSGQLQTIHEASGEFLLEGVEAKLNGVLARADGFARTMIDVNVEPEETTSGVVIRLDPEAFVEGIVLSPAGDPIFGARIFEGSVPNEWQRDQAALDVTDREGHFDLEGLSPTTLKISAYHPDYAAGFADVSLQSSGSTYVEIVMQVGAGVEGTVRVGGVPQSGVHIGAMSTSDPSARQSDQTDSSGLYEINGLGGGTVSVSANYQSDPSGQGNRRMSKSVELQDGFVTTVDFDFPARDVVIEGYLSYGGQNVAQGFVGAQFGSPETGVEGTYSQVGSDGFYRIEGSSSGAIAINASAQVDGRNISRTVRLEVTSGETRRLDIDFTGGSRVVGRVDGMEPGMQGSVVLLTEEADVGRFSEQGMEAWQELSQCCMVSAGQLNEDGTFSVEGVEAGDYKVIVIAFDPQLITDIFTRSEHIRTATGEIEVVEGREATLNLRLE